MSTSITLLPWIGDLDEIDHEVRGKSLLIWQYQDKVRINEYVEILMEEINRLEVVAQQLLTERSLDTAQGVQLDLIGKVVDLLRGELNDNEYRMFLKGKVFCNLGDGQPEQFITLLISILFFEKVIMDEYYPAEIDVFCSDVVYPYVVFELLKLLVGGGIRLAWIFSDQSWTNIFRTSSQLGADDTTTTYGTAQLGVLTVGASGGYLAGSLESTT